MILLFTLGSWRWRPLELQLQRRQSCNFHGQKSPAWLHVRRTGFLLETHGSFDYTSILSFLSFPFSLLKFPRLVLSPLAPLTAIKASQYPRWVIHPAVPHLARHHTRSQDALSSSSKEFDPLPPFPPSLFPPPPDHQSSPQAVRPSVRHTPKEPSLSAELTMEAKSWEPGPSIMTCGCL